MLSLGLVVNLIFVLLVLGRLLLVIRSVHGLLSDDSLLDLADTAVVGFSWAVTVTYYLGAITFAFWYYRAYVNVMAMGIYRRKYSPFVALIAWVAPFANLFIPYQVMREIWTTADPGNDPTDLSAPAKAPAPRLLGLWWFCWLTGAGLGALAGRLPQGPDQLRTFLTFNEIIAASRALLIVGAVLLIQLVTGMTERQEQRAAWMEEWRRSLAAGTASDEAPQP